MSTSPHVIVLGLGITGSSIAATLAEAGYRVTAVEQFSALHDRGSSHGDTRIYRRVPHEGPIYVEMAASSWDGWQEWGSKAGEKLLVDCGGIDAGPQGAAIVQESEQLCREYGLDCEMLTGAALNRKYPHYNLPPTWNVAWQPRSGFVRPDATRTFLHKMAKASNATLLHDTHVAPVDVSSTGVTIRTPHEVISGDFLIVTAGSWLPKVLPDLNLVLSTERRVLAWFKPEESAPLCDGRLPIFCMDGDGGWYGMPTPDGMLKLGHDKHLSQRIDPDQPTIQPGTVDAQKLTPCIERYFTGFSAKPSAMKACIYTITPDHHFIIDRHPANANVILFSCCSGHGFKYAPTYGQIALDMIRGKDRPDLGSFRMGRGGPPITRYGE